MIQHKVYACDLCKTRISFNSGEAYEAHMKQWHQTSVEFKCEQCDKTLSNWQTYKLHMTQNHDARTSSTNTLNRMNNKFSRHNTSSKPNDNETTKNSPSTAANEHGATWAINLESENTDDISLSEELDINLQNLTSFPNQNKKHIDYVLVYEEEEKKNESEENKEKIREAFLKALQAESFEICKIEHETESGKIVYVLLNCAEERLLEEAEITKIQMTLKHSNYEDDEDVYDKKQNEKKIKKPSIVAKLKNLFSKPEYDVEANSNFLSDVFTKSNRTLFEFVDDTKYPNGPFNNCTRTLLVDSILNNIDVYYMFKNKRSHIKGLPAILDEDVFEEAFVLHDTTLHKDFNKLPNNYLQEQFKDMVKSELEHIEKTVLGFYSSLKTDEATTPQPLTSPSTPSTTEDKRAHLQDHWAAPMNVFRWQPLPFIKEYFGEKNGIYFGYVGTFITAMWVPGIVGVIFSIIGASIWHTDEALAFNNAFDNPTMPFFAMFILGWGMVFIQCWKRKNAKLTFYWNCENCEANELDLPSYTKIKEERNKTRDQHTKWQRFFFRHESSLKFIVSIVVFLLMASIVVLDIIASILFRIWVRVKVLPHNEYGQIFMGEVMAEVFNTGCIMILSTIWKSMATKLTHWENHRTKSEYDRSLILKLFSFEFINSYGCLFYLAFIRTRLPHEHGFLGVGHDFVDECENENCMSSITLKLIVILVMFPLPRLFLSLIWPFVKEFFSDKIKSRMLKAKNNAKGLLTMSSITPNSQAQNGKGHLDMEEKKKLNEKAVLVYLNLQREKEEFEDTIDEEYVEKVVMFGFLMLFGSSFSVAPLLIVAVNIIDLRVDAYRLLWLYKRPVGYKAENIGVWEKILHFLVLAGIVCQGSLTAFPSQWSKLNVFLNESTLNRFIYVFVFENFAIFMWLMILVLVPGIPGIIEEKRRKETAMRRHLLEEKEKKEKTFIGIN